MKILSLIVGALFSAPLLTTPPSDPVELCPAVVNSSTGITPTGPLANAMHVASYVWTKEAGSCILVKCSAEGTIGISIPDDPNYTLGVNVGGSFDPGNSEPDPIRPGYRIWYLNFELSQFCGDYQEMNVTLTYGSGSPGATLNLTLVCGDCDEE